MILTLILVAIIVILIILNIILFEWPSLRSLYLASKIHGPKGLPIIGSISFIRSMSGPGVFDTLLKLQEDFPRISKLYVVGVTTFFVYEPEDLQVILGSMNHIKKGKEYELYMPWLQEGLLLSDGAKWHARRKLLTPAFHFRILEDSLGNMNTKTKFLVDKLTVSTGKPINVEHHVTKCVLDILGESAMGIPLLSQSDSGLSYLQKVKETNKAIVNRILNVWQVRDWIFNFSRNGREFYKNINILHSFTEKVIQERKQIYQTLPSNEVTSGKRTPKAFLDCLIDTQRNQPGVLTDLDIRHEVDSFMFAGHDTTSAAISFALWLLGTHLDEQDKVNEELKTILQGEDRDINMDDLHSLVYLEKVIKETLRLFPSVPYISRRLTQDCELDDGTVLPASSNIVILPYVIHRNPKIFPEPEKFDPERFSEENVAGRHPFAYIPFSAGPRNCIGQKFAMMEMKIALGNILRKLEVKSVTRRDEFKILPYAISRPSVPLFVKFTPRL